MKVMNNFLNYYNNDLAITSDVITKFINFFVKISTPF